MSLQEQLDVVMRHYALNSAGDFAAGEQLLTDDFFITIPPYMPFGGVYLGKQAFRESIPTLVKSVRVAGIAHVATTVGDARAVDVVEWTLSDDAGAPMQGAELIRFRGGQICEIKPFYFDPSPMLAAAARRAAGDRPPA